MVVHNSIQRWSVAICLKISTVGINFTRTKRVAQEWQTVRFSKQGKIETLDRPHCSPDVNLVDNLLGKIDQDIYDKTYSTIM